MAGVSSPRSGMLPNANVLRDHGNVTAFPDIREFLDLPDISKSKIFSQFTADLLENQNGVTGESLGTMSSLVMNPCRP